MQRNSLCNLRVLQGERSGGGMLESSTRMIMTLHPLILRSMNQQHQDLAS
jgi:hypothetical protein